MRIYLQMRGANDYAGIRVVNPFQRSHQSDILCLPSTSSRLFPPAFPFFPAFFLFSIRQSRLPFLVNVSLGELFVVVDCLGRSDDEFVVVVKYDQSMEFPRP